MRKQGLVPLSTDEGFVLTDPQSLFSSAVHCCSFCFTAAAAVVILLGSLELQSTGVEEGLGKPGRRVRGRGFGEGFPPTIFIGATQVIT